MKNELTQNDKKVLYRIMQELSIKLPDKFVEFPQLNHTEINNSIRKLNEYGLIFFNDKNDFWEITDEGMKIIQENKEEFKDISEEFDKNLYPQKQKWNYWCVNMVKNKLLTQKQELMGKLMSLPDNMLDGLYKNELKVDLNVGKPPFVEDEKLMIVVAILSDYDIETIKKTISRLKK